MVETADFVEIDLKVHFGQLDKLRTLRIQHCSSSLTAEEFFLSLKELKRLELVDMFDIQHIAGPTSSSFPFPRLSSVFTTGRYTDIVYLLQLAKHCVTAGCPRFTLEVDAGCPGENFEAIKSSIRDERVCIIKSDCAGLITGQVKSCFLPEIALLDEELTNHIWEQERGVY